MDQIHKDLHSDIADRLDEISLLRLSHCSNLRVNQRYWEARVAALNYVTNVSRWKVSDWRKTLLEVTIIWDFNQLTRAIALLEDFLVRQFSVYKLSEIKNIGCYGYFDLWNQVTSFLNPGDLGQCFKHGEDCLCSFHRYLDANRNDIMFFIWKYKYDCTVNIFSEAKERISVYHCQGWIELTDADNDLYHRYVREKIRHGFDCENLVISYGEDSRYNFQFF